MRPSAPPGAGGAPPATGVYWRLSDTVTACLVSERILFLDIARDRYLALPAEDNRNFLAWVHRHRTAPPPSCRPMFAELGLSGDLSDSAPAICRVAGVVPLDPPHLPKQRVRTRDLFGIARAVRSASRDVRSKPLAQIIRERFESLCGSSRPAADLEERLAIFRSARPWIPVPRICLHDCLALMDWLGPSATGVTLVFGVSAEPFAAHSWLQADGSVLDDHPDSPSRYQPILHLP